MKVAVLVSGNQRFSKDLDDFLINIKNYDRMDWFFYLWNNTHEQDRRINPNWPANDWAKVYDIIRRNLPEHHNIIDLRIRDQPEFDHSKYFNTIPIANKINVWMMYYGLKQVNLLKEEYERLTSSYDLVIRTRTDISVIDPIYLDQIKLYLESYPNSIIMPAERNGYFHHLTNDQFAIGLNEYMKHYFTVFDNIDQYTQEGLLMTGETMLGYHLYKNNIELPYYPINTALNRYRNNEKLEYGRWE